MKRSLAVLPLITSFAVPAADVFVALHFGR